MLTFLLSPRTSLKMLVMTERLLSSIALVSHHYHIHYFIKLIFLYRVGQFWSQYVIKTLPIISFSLALQYLSNLFIQFTACLPLRYHSLVSLIHLFTSFSLFFYLRPNQNIPLNKYLELLNHEGT